jgi:tight adherence protein C
MSFALLGSFAVCLAAFAAWWAVSGDRTSKAAVRNLQRAGSPTSDLREAMLCHSASDRVVTPTLERLSDRARALTPKGMIESLERKLLLAGSPPTWAMERVLVVKIVLGIVGLFIGAFMATKGGLLLWVAPAVVALGYFTPDLLLYSRGTERQKAISLLLPDTIDQITVSVEAGLGLEAAIARMVRSGKGPLVDELTRTMQDMRAGMSRNAAFKALIDRTTSPELRAFVTAVIQAEAYGVAVSKVLRIQSAELRIKRRQRAEEQAMKLPVKVLMPLVTCILPTMFILLLGPAAMKISGMFGHINH